MNKYQHVPGREGFYKVLPGRALHWPSVNGKPMIWARSSEVVDLRSAYLCEIAQKTGQYHKLERLDKLPANATLIGVDQIPHEIRSRLMEYEAGRPASSAAPEPTREIDFSALPSAAPEPEPEDVELAPKPPADLLYEPPPSLDEEEEVASDD